MAEYSFLVVLMTGETLSGAHRPRRVGTPPPVIRDLRIILG